MSGYRTSPRFDVVASTRRSWSLAQKRIIIGQIGVDGATVSDVARRHGMHANLLFRWRRELTGTGPAMAPAPRDASGRSSSPAPAPPVFLPVALIPPALELPVLPPSSVPPPSVERRDSAQGSAAGCIEVVLAGGRVVRVGADVDTGALLRIVFALENGALENGALENGR
jgi:transposase